MFESLAAAAVLATALWPAVRAEERGGSARVTLSAALPVYEFGDEVMLQLVFENGSDREVVEFLPVTEAPDSIPSDLLEVWCNGERLAERRNPESHADLVARTTLTPTERLSLFVPLSEFCILPDDPTGGYEVRATDYYVDFLPGPGTKFRIQARSETPPKGVESRLRSALWNARGESVWTAAELERLEELRTEPQTPAALRVRASAVLAHAWQESGQPSRTLALVETREALLLLAALPELSPEAVSVLAPSLLLLLHHEDLGVRRTAIHALSRGRLSPGALSELRTRAPRLDDPWCRRRAFELLQGSR